VSADDLGTAENQRRTPGDPFPLRPVAPGIALWWCDLAPPDETAARLLEGLSAAEHERAARFGTDALRRRWMIGRGTLRQLLGRTLGVAPDTVVLRRGTHGRPQLADASLRLDFNVSHTCGVALIAIARGLAPTTRIGIDIEHADRGAGADRLAAKFLTSRERATIEPLDADARRQRFLQYWTCKEAMSKATGDGLAAPFGRLDIDVGDGLRLVAGPPPYDPPAWTLHAVEAPEGYLATLAIWNGESGPRADAATESV